MKFSVDSKLAVFNCSQFPFSESATYNFKNLISVLVLSPSVNLARSTVNREVMPIPLTHATDEKLVRPLETLSFDSIASDLRFDDVECVLQTNTIPGRPCPSSEICYHSSDLLFSPVHRSRGSVMCGSVCVQKRDPRRFLSTHTNADVDGAIWAASLSSRRRNHACWAAD